MKYQVLMPLLINLQHYVAVFLGVGIVIKLFNLVFRTNVQEDRRALSVSSILWATMPSFGFYTLIYVALPFPGISLTGETKGLTQVSSLVWMVDRIEYGFDVLLVDLLDKDLSVRSYTDEFQQPYVEGGVPVVLPPQKEDLLYYFVAQRGRFMMLMAETNMNRFEVGSSSSSQSRLGAAASLITGGASEAIARMAELPNQIMTKLGSMLIAAVLNGLMLLFGMLILGFASLIKYAIAMFTLAVAFIFPFVDPFTHQFWKKVAKQYLVLFLWKPLIILLVWFGFLMIEAVNLETLVKANQVLDNRETVIMVQSSIIKPGALYTPYGGEIYKESRGLIQKNAQISGFFLESTLVSFGILVLLFFAILAIPVLLMRMTGDAPFAANFLSGMVGYAIAGGMALTRMLGLANLRGPKAGSGNAIQGSNAQVIKNASTKVGDA